MHLWIFGAVIIFRLIERQPIMRNKPERLSTILIKNLKELSLPVITVPASLH